MRMQNTKKKVNSVEEKITREMQNIASNSHIENRGN